MTESVQKRRKPFWTPFRAGIVIGAVVLAGYFFYNPMGFCVGCFLGSNVAWLDYAAFGKQVVFPGISHVFHTPIIGMFLGAFIAALLAGEFWIRRIRPRVAVITFFAGGMVGFGNFVASGCPTRHLIVAAPGLSLEGIVAGIGIVLGIWIGSELIKRTSWFEGG